TSSLQYNHAFFQPALADSNAQWHPNQLPVGKHDARTGIAVVQNDINTLLLELGVQISRSLTHSITLGKADRADHHFKRRQSARPDHAALVMVLLDGSGRNTADANAITPHLHDSRFTISLRKGGVQLLGVDIAKEEYVAHFNAALD